LNERERGVGGILLRRKRAFTAASVAPPPTALSTGTTESARARIPQRVVRHPEGTRFPRLHENYPFVQESVDAIKAWVTEPPFSARPPSRPSSPFCPPPGQERSGRPRTRHELRGVAEGQGGLRNTRRRGRSTPTATRGARPDPDSV